MRPANGQTRTAEQRMRAVEAKVVGSRAALAKAAAKRERKRTQRLAAEGR